MRCPSNPLVITIEAYPPPRFRKEQRGWKGRMVRLYEQVTPNLKLAGRIVGQGTLWCARQLLKTRELMPVSPMEAVSLGGTVMVFSYLGLFNLDSDKELTPRHLLWTMVIVAPTLILSNLYEIRDLFRNP